ncbi:hypothetical protein [Hymenobacter saemangeumensis]
MGFVFRGDTLHLYAANFTTSPDGMPTMVRGRRLFTLLKRY